MFAVEIKQIRLERLRCHGLFLRPGGGGQKIWKRFRRDYRIRQHGRACGLHRHRLGGHDQARFRSGCGGCRHRVHHECRTVHDHRFFCNCRLLRRARLFTAIDDLVVFGRRLNLLVDPCGVHAGRHHHCRVVAGWTAAADGCVVPAPPAGLGRIDRQGQAQQGHDQGVHPPSHASPRRLWKIEHAETRDERRLGGIPGRYANGGWESGQTPAGKATRARVFGRIRRGKSERPRQMSLPRPSGISNLLSACERGKYMRN